MVEAGELATKLHAAVERLVGPPGEILGLRRLTGGATKGTWAFTARIGDSERPFVLQVATKPRPQGDDDPLAALPRVAGAEDAAVMKLAAEHGVPTPPVRAVLTPECGLGEGYITDFVPGETIARRLLREPEFAGLRANFAAQCGEIAGRIHRLDAAKLPFLRRFDAEPQVAAYRRVYESYGHAIPAIEVALRWAEDNIPPCPRLTVVHGDFRMGNAICGPDRIRAFLDWEIASLGDPMQDLGWLCTKTWRFGGREPVGGIGRREDLFAAYEKAAGVPVDRDSVRFWEAWGSAKWGIMCLLKGQAHRRTASERTVEAFAIGRRMEEPLHDFFAFLAGEE